MSPSPLNASIATAVQLGRIVPNAQMNQDSAVVRLITTARNVKIETVFGKNGRHTRPVPRPAVTEVARQEPDHTT